MGFANRYEKQVASLTLISAHFGLPKKERAPRLQQDAKWAKILLERPIDEFLTQWYDQPLFHTLDRDQMRKLRQKQDPISLAKSLIYYSLGRQPLYLPPKGHLLVGEWDQKFRELYAPYSPHLLTNTTKWRVSQKSPSTALSGAMHFALSRSMKWAAPCKMRGTIRPSEP